MKVLTSRYAYFISAGYFLSLGLVNFTATFINSKVRQVDFIILGLAILPILINKRMFHLIFGAVACFISLFMTMACLSFNLDPRVHTSRLEFFMGYLLAASIFTASILLIYSITSQQIQNGRYRLLKN